ncbi:MAG: TetR/AcrR family transcriptional regulator [Pseudomonadota bacterium]
MSTRRPRGRPPKLSQDLILTKAEGFEIRSLSIVKLAKALNVTDAAIYYYFSSREALVRALIDRESGMLAIPEINEQWWIGLKEYALRIYDMLVQRPGAAGCLVAGGITGPQQMQIFTSVIKMLVDAGFEPRNAVRVYALFVRAALQAAHAHDEREAAGGHALFEAKRRELAETASQFAGIQISGFIGDEELNDARKQLDFLLSVVTSGIMNSELV